MREWRVIAVLLAVIVLLSVVLGIKIMKSRSNDQIQVSNNKDYSDTVSDYQEKLNTKDTQSTYLEILSIQEKTIKKSIGLIILVTVHVLFFVLVNYKIYTKLGITGSIVTLYIILSIAQLFVEYVLGSTISSIVDIAVLIVQLILLIKQYQIIGINPALLLLGFIPLVGVICVFVVGIIATCKLADYFNKGTGFKLGLIFLPFIFLPILAFSNDE